MEGNIATVKYRTTKRNTAKGNKRQLEEDNYLLEEGVAGEISGISTGGQDDGTPGLDLVAGLVVELIFNTDDGAVLLDEVGDTSLLNELDAVGLGDGEVLDGLHEGIGDGHTGHLFLATVGSGEGVSSETGDEREIKMELFLEPLDGRGGTTGEDLDQVGAEHLTGGFCGVIVECLDRVLNAELCG